MALFLTVRSINVASVTLGLFIYINIYFFYLGGGGGGGKKLNGSMGVSTRVKVESVGASKGGRSLQK